MNSTLKNKIAQGAEAIIYKEGNEIIKERFEKTYRHPVLDLNLRKRRTVSETKLISEARRQRVNTPQIIDTTEFEMVMEFIPGDKVRDVLNKDNYKDICKKIGEQLSKLHNANVIHGDLTTSNFIWYNNKVYFIDFGLGSISKRIEDKAVDLHLMKQALESKHHEIWEKCFDIVLENYTVPNKKEILERLEAIEKRGRYVKR